MYNAYELILEAFEDRKLALIDRFVPPYASSIGCHIINQHNKKNKVYLPFGRVADLRQHNFFIAPSGFMKTEMLVQFGDEETGLIAGTRVGVAFEGSMTAAAFTGSVKTGPDGEAEIVYGAAKINERKIMMLEEFADLTNAMKIGYNAGLLDAMLIALDRGWVRKRLAKSGEEGIKYPTWLTMWTGSQPVRLDMGSGFLRRIVPIEWMPTLEEMELIEKQRLQARYVHVSASKTMKMKNAMEGIIDGVKQIKKITFSEDFDAMIKYYKMMHFENEQFERIGIGYTVMKGQFDEHLYVEVDEPLKELLRNVIKWRNSVKMDPEINQVVYAIKDQGPMTKQQMLYFLGRYSVDNKQGMSLIARAISMGRINEIGDKLSIGWSKT